MTAFITRKRPCCENEAEKGGRAAGTSRCWRPGPSRRAAGAGAAGHELIGQPDAEDGSDERVGAGSGQAEIPGAQVPNDRGDQEGEDHGEAGAAADPLEDQFDGKERDDAEGGLHRVELDDAEEIPKAAPDDRDVRFEGVGVDDSGDGVGGVMEAINKLEGECDEQGDAQQDVRRSAVHADAF